MKFSELQRLQRMEGIAVLSADERIEQLEARLRTITKERDALRAKIERMEKQEPVAWIVRGGYPVPLDKLEWQLWYGSEKPTLSWVNQETRPLYALPGAQTQNVPKAVAYLDLGTGGYMDIGTDLTDEALAALPKGRHMLGIVGTYGVDALAQFIREVDGSHQLGAGVLAERIAEWLKAAPEAKT